MKLKNIIQFGYLAIILFGLIIILDVVAENKDYKTPIMQLSEIEDPNYEQITNAFSKHWELKADKKPSGWKQYKRWEDFWENRLLPNGDFPNGMKIHKEFQAFKASNKGINRTQSKDWNLLGPETVPRRIGYTRVQGLGRINVISFHPTNPDILWAGAASGGLWKSTDGGQNWNTFPFTDFLSIGVSDIAISEKNPEIVYVATGDADGSYQGSGFYSIGLIKTYYGGLLWETTNLGAELEDRFLISRVLVHPEDPNIVIVGTSGGILKSEDGGNSWKTKLSSNNISDMEFMPGNPDIINATSFNWGGNASFFRSTDGGDSWVKTETYYDCSRLAITVSPDNPNAVYAVGARRGTTSFHSFSRSEDAGKTWEMYINYTVHDNILGRDNGRGNDSLVGQGNYDLCIAVNPNDEDDIWVGGINLWRSIDGGENFNLITHWAGGMKKKYVHADQHDLQFQRNSNKLFSANDGGLNWTNNDGLIWNDITEGMSITQFYKIGQSATDENIVIGGTQDNGTSLLKPDGWDHIYGGDGMECLINPKNPNILYFSLYYGSIFKSSTMGASAETAIRASSVGENAAWVTPFVIDPVNPNILYAGFQNIWKSTIGGSYGSWEKVSNFNGSTFRSMAIAPGNQSTIYAATNTRVYVSYDAGNNWEVSYSSSRPISYIAVDPNDDRRYWITLSNFYKGDKVFEINDGEKTNVSGNLPNVPVNCIVYQNNSPERLYIGTDIGVFYSDYGSQIWELYGDGLPNVVIKELEIYYPTNKLRAASYGRGLWETTILDCNMEQPEVTLIGDLEICKGDTVIIEAQEGFDKYEWSNGETNRIINVTETGNYSVRVFDDNDCSANSKAISIEVYNVPAMKIFNAGKIKGYCSEDSVKLTASMGYNEFLWSNGKDSRVIYVNEPGNYWVEGTHSSGCVRRSDIIEIKELSIPPKPEIEREGNLLTATASEIEIAGYKWFLNDKKISGANKKTYLIIEPGLYHVEISDTNGCTNISDKFDLILGVADGIDEVETIKIRPNPGLGIYNIEIANLSIGKLEITVTNLLGITVYSTEIFHNEAGIFSMLLNIENLPIGSYMLNIKTNRRNYIEKIIKQ